MENFRREATRYTPDILLDYENGLISIKGRSYPENTAEFYSPVFSWLETYLGLQKGTPVTVDMELVYFNSSSSKVIMNLFDVLEEAAGKGLEVTVNWIYDVEDDTIEEYGQEFKEDLISVVFNLVPREV